MPASAMTASPITTNMPVLRGAPSYAGAAGIAASGACSPNGADGGGGGGIDERGSTARVMCVADTSGNGGGGVIAARGSKARVARVPDVSAVCGDGGIAASGAALRAAVEAPESHDASASIGGMAPCGGGAVPVLVLAGTKAVSSPNATGVDGRTAVGCEAGGGVTIIDSSAAGAKRGVSAAALDAAFGVAPVASDCPAVGVAARVASTGGSAVGCDLGGVLRVAACAMAAVTVVDPPTGSAAVAWAAPQ